MNYAQTLTATSTPHFINIHITKLIDQFVNVSVIYDYCCDVIRFYACLFFTLDYPDYFVWAKPFRYKPINKS